jgi:hypothetical protein
MKNLFIASILFLTSLTLTAQESFNGMWLNEGSDYICTILASEYAVVKCYNTSFEEYDVIPEEIIKQDGNSFTSRLHNPDNGYTVSIEYTLISKDTISAKYSGDSDEYYLLTRLY